MNKGYPLPALSTLQDWASKVTIQEGIIHPVLSLMQKKADCMTNMEKLCCLCFDEVYTSRNIEIDKKLEKRVGPHKTVQVGMARRLFSKWKQPAYFAFDKSLTKEIMFDVIKHLFNSGYTVVSLTTDLSSTNVRLQKSLGIKVSETSINSFFEHPQDKSLKNFYIADVLHSLKLIRNNFVDSGFTINGKYITKYFLEKLVLLNKGDLKIVHKLETKHIDAKGAERQKVSYAAKVLSNTTAEAIRYCGLNGFFDDKNSVCKNYNECADFIKLTNDWFDLMNSTTKYGCKKKSHAYGVDLQNQNLLLDKMSDCIKNLKVGTKKSLLSFQKGILLSNSSLKSLLSYLQQKYEPGFKIDYIITRRLNQDVLENFFSYVRAMGAAYEKFSALQFQYRLKWYILGKHSSDMIIDTCNTEKDEDFTLVDVTDLKSCSKNTLKAMEDVMGSLYDEETIFTSDISDNIDTPESEPGTTSFKT